MDNANDIHLDWLDINAVADKGLNWNVFVGARRIGKTYGILKRFMTQSIRFLYMRRTKDELQRAVEEGLFTKLNRDLGMEYTVVYNKKEGVGDIYSDIEKTTLVGKAMALSVVSSFRGVDYDEYDELFIDEVVPEQGAWKTTSEGVRAVQAFETIFGNRELPPICKAPMRVWLAMNPIDIFDSILSELNLMELIVQLALRGQKQYVDRKRSLYIYFGTQEGIAELKRQTSLYQFIGDRTEMANHLLDGVVRGDKLNSLRKKIDFRHYKCIADIDENIFLYIDKRDDSWHFSTIKANCQMHFKTVMPYVIRKKFASRYKLLRTQDMVSFDSATILELVDALLG